MWGDDFSHQSADTLDTMFKMREHVNNLLQTGYSSGPDKRDVEIVFSTMEDYFNSVRKDAKSSGVSWPTYSEDFWRYNIDGPRGQYSYWSGYFSTYPDFKKEVARFSDFAEAAAQITALSKACDEGDIIEEQT